MPNQGTTWARNGCEYQLQGFVQHPCPLPRLKTKLGQFVGILGSAPTGAALHSTKRAALMVCDEGARTRRHSARAVSKLDDPPLFQDTATAIRQPAQSTRILKKIMPRKLARQIVARITLDGVLARQEPLLVGTGVKARFKSIHLDKPSTLYNTSVSVKK